MMNKFSRKLGAVLAVAACVTFVGTPVMAGSKLKGPVDARLPHILTPHGRPSTGTFTWVVGQGQVNTKSGKAQIKAQGTVGNPLGRKLSYKGLGGTLFFTGLPFDGNPADFVCTYNVAANGAAKLDAKN